MALQLGKAPFSYYGRALASQRSGDAAAAEADLATARALRPSIDAEVHKAGFDVAAGAIVTPSATAAAASAP